jgi:hypothetical protein
LTESAIAFPMADDYPIVGDDITTILNVNKLDFSYNFELSRE